jgi:hypothetical protein
MQRGIIEDILARVAAELPEFKTVKLFNDQLFKQDGGEIDSFAFPALFLSFPDGADYSDYTGGVQQAKDVTIRFYIADKLTKSRLSISKTELEIMDLKQKVYSKFQGFSGNGFKAMSRIHEETDEDRTNYYNFVQDYKANLVDSCTYVDQGTEVNLTLDLTTDVIINPNTDDNIRTAKDVNDD